jgi:hypothetical protein
MTYTRLHIRAMLLSLTLAGPALAGDCWVDTVDDGSEINMPMNAGLRTKVLQAEQALRADAGINAIDRVRYQAHRFIGYQPLYPGAPLAAHVDIYLHKPRSWAEGCSLREYADEISFASLNLTLNDLGALASLGGDSFTEEDLGAFLEPPLTGRRDGYPIYAHRVLLITPPGIEPLTPVSVAEYLDFWERRLTADAEQMTADAQPDGEWLAYIAQLEQSDPQQAAELRQTLSEGAVTLGQGQTLVTEQLQRLRQRRDSLSPAQRRAPVYLTSEAMEREPFGYATAPGAGAQRLVRVNPVLWQGARSSQSVRSVILRIGVSAGGPFDNGDRDPQTDQASAWFDATDLAPYRALLDL